MASCREADSGRRRTAGRSATRWEISEEVGIFRRDRWKAYETVSGHWNLDTRFGPGLSVELVRAGREQPSARSQDQLVYGPAVGDDDYSSWRDERYRGATSRCEIG